MEQTHEKTYYSNGNLLISGEYFVLVGAKALAIPLKYGQKMTVEESDNDSSGIHWEAYENGILWFVAKYDIGNFNILYSSNTEKAFWLQKLLKNLAAHHNVFDKSKSYHFTSHIQFKTNWGWGSSSSLICNLASWAKVDPYVFNRTNFPGSGYDIAASQLQKPLYYQLIDNNPVINTTDISPEITRSTHFIYLGIKQNTNESIKAHRQAILKNKGIVKNISSLTEKIAESENTNELIRNITEHEKIISKTLKIQTVKEKYFSDFEGGLKSLGAWGGDFIMAVSPKETNYIKEYFKNKGLDTVFKMDGIIKNSNVTVE